MGSTPSYTQLPFILKIEGIFFGGFSYLHYLCKMSVNNIPFLKIEKKVQGKIEQAKLVISIMTKLMNIRLSDSETIVLAYFMVYGVGEQTKDLIVKSQVLAGVDSLNNSLSKLRKVGLLHKHNKQDLLNVNLDIKLEPIIGILIKLDNR